MPPSRWQKRALKFRGLVNQAGSFLTFRHTAFNRRRLQNVIRAKNIKRLHAGCGDVLLDGWLNVLYERREAYGILNEDNGKLFLKLWLHVLSEFPALLSTAVLLRILLPFHSYL